MSAPVPTAIQNAQGMALDWNKWYSGLSEPRQKSVTGQLAMGDATAIKRDMTNLAFLRETYRLPTPRIQENLTDMMRDYSIRQQWGEAWRDRGAFHQKVVEKLTKDRDEHVMRYGMDDDTEEAEKTREASLAAQAYSAGVKWSADGEGGVEAYQKWEAAAKTAPSYNPKNSDQYYFQFMGLFHEGRADQEAAQYAAEQAFPVLSKSDEGYRNAKDAVPFVRNLTPNQRKLFVQGIKDLSAKYPANVEDRNFLEQGAIAFGRTLRGISESMDRMQNRDALMEDVPRAGAGETGKKAAQRTLSDVQLEAEIKNLTESTVSPLRRDRWYEKVSVGGGQSLAYMATIAVPYVGIGVSTLAYSNDATEKYIANNIPVEKARILGGVAGPVMAMLDKVELMAFGLKLPGMTALAAKLTPKGTLPLFLGRLGVGGAAEMVVETVQDPYVEASVQQVAATFDKEMKGVKWADVHKEAWAQQWDNFWAVLPMMLVGTANASFRDFKNFKELAGDPERMKLAGFSPEQIEKIAAAPDSQTAAKMVQQFWPQRTVAKSATVGKSPDSVKTGVTSGAVGIPSSENVSEEKAASDAPGETEYIPPLRRDDNGWALVMEDGSRVQVGTVEAGIHAREQLMLSKDAESAQGYVAMADEIFALESAAGHKTAQTITGDTAIFDKEAGSVTAIGPKGSVTVHVLKDGKVQEESREVSAEEAKALKAEAEAMLPAYDALAFTLDNPGVKLPADKAGLRIPAEAARALSAVKKAGGDVRAELEKMRSALKADAGALGKVKIPRAPSPNLGSVDAAALEQQLAAMMPGETQAVMQGRNWLAEDGVRWLETNKSAEGALTSLHEFVESRVKAYADPATMRQLAAAALPSLQSGKPDAFSKRVEAVANGTASDDQARETGVELLVANEISIRKDGKRFTPGTLRNAIRGAITQHTGGKTNLRALLGAVRAYLKGLFTVAAKIAKARREGKIKDGDDFTEIADRLLGRTPQREHNEAVAKEIVEESPGNAPAWMRLKMRQKKGETAKPQETAEEDDGMGFSLGSADFLESAARQAEGMGGPPKEKLAAAQAMASELYGMARAVRGNDSVADAVSASAIERERSEMREERETELLRDIDKDFGDLTETEFRAKATNLPVISEVVRVPKGGGFPRGRIRSITSMERAGREVGGEYNGAEGVPSWLFGGTMTPDQMAQELGMEVEQMWNAIKGELKTAGASKERLSKYAQARAEAKQQARDEANEWAQDQLADLPKRQKDKGRKDMLRALQALDVMLFKLPAEVRAKIGGFTKLASLTTNEAREKFFAKRLEKIGKELEKHLRKEYRAALDKVIEKGQPDKEAGEKAKGKIGPEAHRFFEYVNTVTGLSADEVEAAQAAQEKLYEADGITDAMRADIFERQQILDTFGNLKGKTAAELAAALKTAEEIYTAGRNKWRTQEEMRLADVAEKAASVVEKLGAGTYGKTQEQKGTDPEAGKKARSLRLELRSFAGFMRFLLGDAHPLTKDWSRRAREGFAFTDDSRRALQKEWNAAVEAATGKKGLKARLEVWDMANKQTMEITLEGEATSKTETVPVSVAQNLRDGTIKPDAVGLTPEESDAVVATLNENEANRNVDGYTAKPLEVKKTTRAGHDSVKMTEAEGMFITMLAGQEQYAQALDNAGFTAGALKEIEDALSPAAKKLRAFLSQKYEAGYSPLNKVFARMFGVDLPLVKNYAPASFYHTGDAKAKGPDSGAIPEGGFRASFLKTRKQHRAAPQLENAFSAFFGHSAQMDHWRAFAEFSREMHGVLGRPEVKRAIEGAHGEAALNLVTDWMKAIEGNGIQKARGEWDKFTGWLLKQAAYIQLGWKLSTLVIQSTAALGAAYRMPAGAYLRGAGRLLTGRLEFRKMWNSPAIQRRIESGFAPEVRAVLSNLWAAKPSRRQIFLDQGLENLGVVDAFFTTMSAAIAHDYHYRAGMKAGMTAAQAEANAESQVAEIISETAQPSTVTDKSMFENKQGNIGKLAFMYASESRQKTALLMEAWGKTLTGQASARDVQVLVLSHLIIGPLIQAIRNAMMDARDEDEDEFDDRHWKNPWEWLKAVAMGPLNGVPLLADLTSGFKSDNAAVGRFVNAAKSLPALLEGPPATEVETGEWRWNRIVKVMQGMDAATGTAASIADQLFDITDNFTETVMERGKAVLKAEAKANKTERTDEEEEAAEQEKARKRRDKVRRAGGGE